MVMSKFIGKLEKKSVCKVTFSSDFYAFKFISPMKWAVLKL